MSDVFISYSRKDTDFVKALYAALEARNRSTWVDWSNIPLTADWWQEIQTGIESADTFVFIISSDSVASAVCNQEIDHAVLHHKRLFPIVRRNEFDLSQVHPALQKRNWLFFRETDDFDRAFHQLLEALDTDLEHVRQHTKLLIKAIEWEKSRRDDSFLLRGNGLADIEQWLAHSKDKQPRPTELQNHYVIASEQWQRQEIERLQSLYEQAEQRRIEAERNEVKALCKSSEALFISNQEFEALLEALRAVRRLKLATWTEANLQKQVRLALQQAVYGVKERNRLEIGDHPVFVKQVCFSPDGTLIAAAVNAVVNAQVKGSIILWSSKGQQIRTLARHESYIMSVCFSPDGQAIASGDASGKIYLWSLEGQRLRHYHDPTGIGDIQFTPDGALLIAGSNDGAVRGWTVEGEEILTLPTAGYVTSIDISPDGTIIAAAGGSNARGGGNGIVRLWTIAGQELQTLDGHIAPVMAVCFDATGTVIASSGWDRKIKLWSLNGQELQSLDADCMGNQGSCEAVLDVRFSPDGTSIAAATQDGLVKLWSSEGHELGVLKGHTSKLCSISFSPTNNLIASGSVDGTVRLWNLSDQTLLTLTSNKSHGFLSIGVSPDGQWVVAGSHDGIIAIWDRQGQLLKLFQGHQNCINDIGFSPDGQTFATASNNDTATVRLWNLDGDELQQFIWHNRGVYSVSFSPDGQSLLSVGWEDGTIRLWNLKGQLLKTIDGARLDARFSPDSQIIAAADAIANVTLWNLDGENLNTLSGHKDTVRRLCFSPDGQIIATASDDKTIKLWSISGEELKTLTGHQGRIQGLSFSPCGQYLASASVDKTIKLWNLEGQELKTLKGHGNSVSAVCFSPDGEAIVSASMDNTVKLWNAEILDFDELVIRGSNWVQDYLQTNPNVEESDRLLCDQIMSKPRNVEG
ncbi:TIR domain-containing protein [Leptolyngbya sp. FACHB-671]|uniref:WD40 domain-containing protein n=1 Tax=Leptolyngbya sp. FACHB-671 TaxID=2692812 RepID=UPI0016887A86|nr:TIR domain-containing protein [Leptolyngbya sp. FACHB-671]MBD2066357.1 TIR domain-containing protein [Leptolyngbya sp. FACHB-671]